MAEFDRVKSRSGEWMLLFSRYQIGVYGDQEIIRGTLHPHLAPGNPEVERILGGWGGRWFLSEEDGGRELVLLRAAEDAPAPDWSLHAFLFALTVFTTLMAGALLEGVDPLHAEPLYLGPVWVPLPTTVDWPLLLLGVPFAGTLLGILLAHELGHYVAARVHRIRVTPPFFIPFPAYYSIVGTLGAFIRLKGPLVRRSILFDVGAAGPWASFVLSLPALVYGMSMSRPTSGFADGLTPFVVEFGGQPIWIGASVATRAVAEVFFGGRVGVDPLVLHPVAFAGWVGLFVTALNLLPFGQLDGGHVLHALAPRIQRWVGYAFLVLLLPLGFLWWGWWLWGGVAVVLGRGRIRHPPVLQGRVHPGPARTVLAIGTILIFFLTFIPVPLAL